VRERDFSPANRGYTSPLFELVIRAEADNDVMLLLENTAGEKNSVGSSFEHIGAILDGLPFPGRVTGGGIELTIHALVKPLIYSSAQRNANRNAWRALPGQEK
jgi:hypothetical protein